METKFNFNSQVATTREQSERLLALSLKKETADMAIEQDTESTYEAYYYSAYPPSRRGIPAWSLHRLLELALVSKIQFAEEGDISKVYDFVIDNIEWQIKEGYFNKEYLESNEAIEEHCKGVLEYLDYIREED